MSKKKKMYAVQGTITFNVQDFVEASSPDEAIAKAGDEITFGGSLNTNPHNKAMQEFGEAEIEWDEASEA